MPLKKIFTHQLIKLFRIILPITVIILATIPAWNYWARLKQKSPIFQGAGKLPKELSLRTENFNFSKTQGDRTVFTVHAKTNLGFSDDKNMLQDVDVIIYGDNPSDPPRTLKSKDCNYDHKTDDITCNGGVELKLDEQTTARSEQVVYSHADRQVSSNVEAQIERPGTMTGRADSFQYWMNTGLLKLTGRVVVKQTDGIELRAGTAFFQQKENWASASDNVIVKSKNGWVQGAQARSSLTPETYQPQTVIVSGDVRSEASTTDGAKWKLQSASMITQFSGTGIAKNVLAQTGVQVEKFAQDGNLDLSGEEVEAHMTDAGLVDVVEARGHASMKFGDDRLLTSNKIVTNTTGGMVTEGDSNLQVGDARLTGRAFDIQNGDLITLRTPNRATLIWNARETTGDKTEATFDNRTNQLVSMIQTGHFGFKETDRHGQSEKARFEDGGDVVFLEGGATVFDGKTQVQAQAIQVNDKTKTQVANGNVVTVSTASGEKVLVKAESAQQTADAATYTGHVRLYRSGGTIEADRVEGPVGQKVFRATAIGHVFSSMNNIRAWAERLDYDDESRIAHYTGNVTAQKQDIKISGADMVVKLKDDQPRSPGGGSVASVSEVTAKTNVVVRRARGTGTGDQAVYNAEADRIVLTGPAAQATDGEGTTTRGPRITLNVSGDKMSVVEGAGDRRAVTTHKVPRP